MATFTWTPSYDVEAESTPRVLTAGFGDGYEQRIGDGINRTLKSWPLEFLHRSATEANAIEAFLVARGGVESFDWTPPWGSASKFVCKTWRRSMTAGNWVTLTATFVEVIA